MVAVMTQPGKLRQDAVLLERELLVGKRLEGHAVQRRDPVLQDRLSVRWRGVPHVLGEAPTGVLNLGVLHVAVARNLRNDRGRGHSDGKPHNCAACLLAIGRN